MSCLKSIEQNDETDCGPACLAAIFRKYGLKLSIGKNKGACSNRPRGNQRLRPDKNGGTLRLSDQGS